MKYSRFLAFLLLLLFWAATIQAIPTSNLVGYWSGDGTTADTSGNNNNGTLQGEATYAPGKFGQAFSLDGLNDYVNIVDSSSLRMSSQMTMSAWIFSTGIGSGAHSTHGGIIINKEGEFEFTLHNSGTIFWAFANSNPGWAWRDSGARVETNEWTHIAITYNAGTIKTYRNGVLAHTFNGAGNIGDVSSSQNNLQFGSRQCCNQDFQGLLDEVAMYNVALDDGQVAELAQTSFNTTSSVAVPEPASWLLLGGALVLLSYRRKPRS